jgi:hypothetical protein
MDHTIRSVEYEETEALHRDARLLQSLRGHLRELME